MGNDVRRYFKNLLITSASPLLTAQTGFEHGKKTTAAAAMKDTDSDVTGRTAVFQTDVVLEEKYNLTNEVTMDLVQEGVKGQTGTDTSYARRLPMTLTIEGAVGSDDNALIGSVFRNAQRLGQQVTQAKDFINKTADSELAQSGSYPAVAFRNLSVFANELILCRVTAGFATYQNMIITSLNVSRDRTNTNSMIFRVTFRQLRTETYELNIDSLSKNSYELESGWEFLGARKESKGRRLMETLDPAASGSIVDRFVANYVPVSDIKVGN